MVPRNIVEFFWRCSMLLTLSFLLSVLIGIDVLVLAGELGAFVASLAGVAT